MCRLSNQRTGGQRTASLALLETQSQKNAYLASRRKRRALTLCEGATGARLGQARHFGPRPAFTADDHDDRNDRNYSMSTWWPSWLQGITSLPIPTFGLSLPSDIQRRFLSYILRRSLGRFLKPGQLDVQQIDSQIGSGYVQINDLEVDHEVRHPCHQTLVVRSCFLPNRPSTAC
jgi:hypothetical protein